MNYHITSKSLHLLLGFKENTSTCTITCTQLLIETVEYYNSNNTSFMLLLDASKAFDRIEYVRVYEF